MTQKIKFEIRLAPSFPPYFKLIFAPLREIQLFGNTDIKCQHIISILHDDFKLPSPFTQTSLHNAQGYYVQFTYYFVNIFECAPRRLPTLYMQITPVVIILKIKLILE